MSKKELTKKQQEILLLLYLFRYINSKQIQKFLHHKDHRRINSWLKDLEEKEYIQREFKLRYGVMTKPAVCMLASKGKKYIYKHFELADSQYLTRMRNDTKRTTSYKARLQLVADFCFIFFDKKEFIQDNSNQLHNGIKLRNNTFQFFTPAYYDYLDFILIEKLKPDGYIYKKLTSGNVHSFISVIDAYVPRLTLYFMLKKFFTTLSNEYWQKDTVTALHLYYICPNNMVQMYLLKQVKTYLQNYSNKTPLIIHFVTRNQLQRRLKDPVDKIKWSEISSEDV